MSNDRDKITHALWGKLSRLGGDEITLRMDDLARHYEVNEFNIIVEGPLSWSRCKVALDHLRDQLINELLAEGWVGGEDRHEVSFSLTQGKARIQIDGPVDIPGGLPTDMWVQVW